MEALGRNTLRENEIIKIRSHSGRTKAEFYESRRPLLIIVEMFQEILFCRAFGMRADRNNSYLALLCIVQSAFCVEH